MRGLTFKHVHHAEEGEREGRLPTTRAAANPDLEREKQVYCYGSSLERWGGGVLV
jgi:hypothetical protein